jgi:hypothetical protein
MTGVDAAWKQRIAGLWPAIDDHDEVEFRARIGAVLAESPQSLTADAA